MAVNPSESSDREVSNADSPRVGVSPNSVSDQPTKVDTLGFKPYVEAVAVFLTHSETTPPLTLSVEGGWGSGKSSFMLQLEDRIRAKGGKTVWFNAWRHDKEDELWAAFAVHFTANLARTVPAWKRWFLHLQLSWRRFDWRRGWFQLAKFAALSLLFLYISIAFVRYAVAPNSTIRQFFSTAHKTEGATQNSATTTLKPEDILLLLVKVGGTAGYVLLGFLLLRKIADVIGNPLQIHLADYIRDPKYEARAAFIDSFHSDFDRLVRTYADKQRVFVFVDDLDRCEVPKAAELMQALNLLISESAPVFYILGLDREKIAAGLAAKYEKLLPYLSGNGMENTTSGSSGTEFGYTYLEKFIQLPFLVPQPSEPDLDRLLDSLGAAATKVSREQENNVEVDPGLLVELSADSSSVREIVRMVAPSFDYNPRRVKQFVNLFRLRALLASQTGLFGPTRDSKRFDPLTLEQLGKLVAIMLRWPLLFGDMEANSGMLKVLQEIAWGRDYKLEPGPTKFWASKHNFMQLLRFPARLGFRIPDDEVVVRFTLERVDIDRFLQVSPMIRVREARAPTTTGAPARPPGTEQSREEANASERAELKEHAPDESAPSSYAASGEDDIAMEDVLGSSQGSRTGQDDVAADKVVPSSRRSRPKKKK